MSRQSLSLANTQCTWEQTSEPNNVQNWAGGAFRGTLDTLRRLHRHTWGVCSTGSPAGVHWQLWPQHIHDSCWQTHQHSPAHRSRAAPAACTHQESLWDTALGLHCGGLAGLPCTMPCHDPHGTSSSLPWASSMAIWATGEILLEVTTCCFKENELRTSFPQNTAALDHLPKAGKRRDYICLSVKAPVPLPAPWALWYTCLGALSEWVREETPHLYVKTEPVPRPDSFQS